MSHEPLQSAYRLAKTKPSPQRRKIKILLGGCLFVVNPVLPSKDCIQSLFNFVVHEVQIGLTKLAIML
jgi:hypothetical protein